MVERGTVSEATSRAAGEDIEALRAEISELQTKLAEMIELRAELESERSKGFCRRLFRLPPRAPEDTERARERIRGRIALTLITALIIVVGLTFWYLLMLSRNLGTLKTDFFFNDTPTTEIYTLSLLIAQP